MSFSPQRILAPSLLAAPFLNLKEEIQSLEVAGGQWIHIDIMDGHFVPNLSFSPDIVKEIRKITSLVIDCHLMVTHPAEWIKKFLDAGADRISFHIEAYGNVFDLLNDIHSAGKKAGLALSPQTAEDSVLPFFPLIDHLLILAVEPGKSGQFFLEKTFDRLSFFQKKKEHFPFLIQVDGGVTPFYAKKLWAQGVDSLVVGSSFYSLNKTHSERLKEFQVFI